MLPINVLCLTWTFNFYGRYMILKKRIVMKKLILLMCVLSSTLTFGQKVAYVYSDSILLSVPGYAKNLQKLDSIRQSFVKDIETSQKALQERYDKLVKPYIPKETETLPLLKKRMAPADTLGLNLILDDSKQLQNKQQTYDRILQANQNKDIQPILDRVKLAVIEYAQDNGLSAVYSMEQIQQALVYVDLRQNITQAVIGRLKKKE